MKRQTFLSAVLAAAVVLSIAGPSSAQQQGQGRRRGGFGGGGALQLLNIAEVQTELKLQPAQIELLKAVGGERLDRAALQNLSQEERTKLFATRRAEQDKKIAEILDAKQMARLKQLEIQQAGLHGVTQMTTAEALKLTADQKSKIDAILMSEREANRGLFGGNNGQRPTAEERQALFTKLREARTANDLKIAAILTDPQKKSFEAMKGAEFKFPERRRGGNNN